MTEKLIMQNIVVQLNKALTEQKYLSFLPNNSRVFYSCKSRKR